MACTTILVGKKATYDGSTMMARNEDAADLTFDPKKFVVVRPDRQPRLYKAVLSKVRIELNDTPMRYTAMPNALPTEGIWGEAGFNEENVAMSATETITSNPRVLGADPLVKCGIGEEDMVTITLPYIHSARDGVKRLGALLEQYGTYEMNGIGFQDMNEIWWLESIGGHHWIAKRVPDDAYVVMPNQMGIDYFDFADAYGKQENHMCSSDMIEFVEKNHLDISFRTTPLAKETHFDARAAFGSHSDADHCYNTPRAWYMGRYFNPKTYRWDGDNADYNPESDNIPWCFVPEKKITVEDIKYVLSSHYQGTDYSVYNKYADPLKQGKYRPIGVNRNNFVAITQLRPYVPAAICAVEWIAEGSNTFNAVVPFYGNVNKTPAYLRDTGKIPTTENFYWANRIIGALADAHYDECAIHVERYQNEVHSTGHAMLKASDEAFAAGITVEPSKYLEECNQKVADYAKEKTYELLDKVLYSASVEMRNEFCRSDA